MLKDALKKRDFNEDAVILAKAANIIREDIFCHDGFTFTGCFPPECQEKSLPASFKYLISMILNGSNMSDQDKHDSQACLTVGFCTTQKREHPILQVSHQDILWHLNHSPDLHWSQYSCTD